MGGIYKIVQNCMTSFIVERPKSALLWRQNVGKIGHSPSPENGCLVVSYAPSFRFQAQQRIFDGDSSKKLDV